MRSSMLLISAEIMPISLLATMLSLCCSSLGGTLRISSTITVMGWVMLRSKVAVTIAMTTEAARMTHSSICRMAGMPDVSTASGMEYNNVSPSSDTKMNWERPPLRR